jgi:membrane protein YqaA with SNARE-associated domain
LPPAFTVMVFFQVLFGLDIWPVVTVGVIGSILGRYLLTLYIPYLSDKVLTQAKTKDVQFLGSRISEHTWKTQGIILLYTLLPLPTTPIFIAGGMARVRALYIIPAFTIGKFTSDAISVHLGSYASENVIRFIERGITWHSIAGLVIGLLLLGSLLLINWRVLIINKKLLLNFHIWKHRRRTDNELDHRNSSI